MTGPEDLCDPIDHVGTVHKQAPMAVVWYARDMLPVLHITHADGDGHTDVPLTLPLILHLTSEMAKAAHMHYRDVNT